jgi:MFS family permease
LRWRLSLLMFLQYAPPGAVVPLLSRHLEKLGFTPLDIGCVCATQALAALVGPLAAGQLADRWWPAQRCLAVCGLLAGIVLWAMAGLTDPWPMFAAGLIFWLFMGPALTLGTGICFTHLRPAERHYGSVRLWGTVGWAAAGWLVGGWLALAPQPVPRAELADLFHVAALLALGLSGYALTLPHTPPQRRLGSPLAPLAALRVLGDRSFAAYTLGSLAVCLTMAFYSQGTPLLLQRLGVGDRWLSPLQTLSQGMEVLSLVFLPALLGRLGLRRTMLLGLSVWTLGLAAFAAGGPLGLVVAMLGSWGVCVGCYLVAGQVFVNSRACGDIRTSAQGLLNFVNGVGMLIGNLLAGGIRAQAGGTLPPTFALAAGLMAAGLFVFILGFGANASTAPAGEIFAASNKDAGSVG